MTASIAASPANFHLSLNVADIRRSVDFFSKVFGCGPAKQRSDYAKFEVANPPLTLSLEPSPPVGMGALNHVGFRLANAEQLVDLQRRLEMSGLSSQREDGVECCYAKQTKFWLHDPDGNLWEFYVLQGDIDHRGAGQPELAVLGKTACQPSGAAVTCCRPAEPAAFSHRLGETFSVPLPFADESLEAVKLQGTFNDASGYDNADMILAEVARVLKPGGRLSIHNLTASSPLEGTLQLPGPAAMVKAVPVDVELLDWLQGHGFTGVRLLKFGAAPCFQLDGVEMRETMLEAFRLPVADEDNLITLVYKGPFQAVTLDSGRMLRRGERCQIPASEWETLRSGPVGDECVVMQASQSPAGCTA